MRDCTLVISRAAPGQPERRAFEDAVLARLADAGPRDVLVVPCLYNMADAHPGLAALREIPGDLVVAAWFHPRATYWLLRARGVDGGLPACSSESPSDEQARTLRLCNLADFDSPDACIREMPGAADTSAGGKPSPREIADPVTDRWYPVLDREACVACGQCHDFCLFGVYTLDAEDRPVVTVPDNCKPGCVACARLCPAGAIIYPLSSDEGIAGNPDKRPAPVPIDAEAFFAASGEPCPVCGCACDCERSTDGTAPPGKTVCPACGCICDPSAVCRCKGDLRLSKEGAGDPARTTQKGGTDKPRDELDDLIDALDELDV